MPRQTANTIDRPPQKKAFRLVVWVCVVDQPLQRKAPVVSTTKPTKKKSSKKHKKSSKKHKKSSKKHKKKSKGSDSDSSSGASDSD